MTKDCLVTREAYSLSPAPAALATKAVVPTTNALNTEKMSIVGCAARPVALIARGPRVPT